MCDMGIKMIIYYFIIYYLKTDTRDVREAFFSLKYIPYKGGRFFQAPIPCGKKAQENFPKNLPTMYVDPPSLF